MTLLSKLFLHIYRKRIKRRAGFKYLPYVKKPFFITQNKNIVVGKNFCANENVVIEALKRHGDETYDSLIVFGDNVFINRGCHFSAINKMKIGNNSVFGSYVSVIDNDHGSTSSFKELLIPVSDRVLSSKGPITIGDNVWVGDKATILSGVTVGDNSIIGANSVVTKDIPSNSIAVGCPAKVIKTIKTK